jgi:hypothetical protein
LRVSWPTNPAISKPKRANHKGTGTSYGFPDITRLGAAAERAAKESDKPEVSRQMADLFACVEAASRQLA